MKFYSEVIKEICFLGFKLKQEKITTIPVYINWKVIIIKT